MADDASPLPLVAKKAPALTAPQRRLFSRAEFQAMVSAGILEDGGREELVGGEVWLMASEGPAHEDGTAALARVLRDICGSGFEVLMRSRLDVDSGTEVYPDLIVQDAGVRVRQRGPANVALIAEVSESTLRQDRTVKSPRYAAAGFQEFWIYEPQAGRIWVHRDPMADGRWGEVFKREAPQGASPLFAPEATLVIPVIEGSDETP